MLSLREFTKLSTIFSYKMLEKYKVPLSPDERSLVMKRKAVWHHGPGGSSTPAVWKSVIGDRSFYVTNTHRAFNFRPTLKGAIRRYHDFIKGTS